MKTALIIPAYKPGLALRELLELFGSREEFRIILVDDGSPGDHRALFSKLPKNCTLLRHPVNRGKGAALKTGMRYVLDACPECALLLTADADGQHRPEDILRVNEAARSYPGALTLGSRQLDPSVPLRSRVGNAITRRLFHIITGQRVYDTQTGLRAFGRSIAERFVQVTGNRYEYEINMLMEAAQQGMEIREVPIHTVYLNGNASSHFRPVRDSMRLYLSCLRYALSSFCAFLIDYALFMLVSAWTAQLSVEVSLAISTLVARVVSAGLKFAHNRRFVFRGGESVGRALAKYAALTAAMLLMSYALVYLLTVHASWPRALAKPVVEVALFFIGFSLQGRLVYHGRTKGDLNG